LADDLQSCDEEDVSSSFGVLGDKPQRRCQLSADEREDKDEQEAVKVSSEEKLVLAGVE
jgi:hypothetical protein